jgi:hypothetical protein
MSLGPAERRVPIEGTSSQGLWIRPFEKGTMVFNWSDRPLAWPEGEGEPVPAFGVRTMSGRPEFSSTSDRSELVAASVLRSFVVRLQSVFRFSLH